MNYACEAAMGTVCGLRSFTGPAVISGAAVRKMLKLEDTPLAWLAKADTAHATALLAAVELIADKLPFIPDRTDAPSLAFRFISGAICGAAVARRRKRSQQILSGLVAGSVAIAAAYAGHEYRRRVKLSPLAAAVLEDVVAVGVGTAVVARLCS